jgi:NAD(P)-dependent dehydrogenase (short-subunit alcohol dehydrogenase family)
MSIEGRGAIVTGAGRGIGFATARLLCQRGMKVAINDLEPGAAARAAADLRAQGHSAAACAGDVSRRADVRAIFAAAETEFGPPWLLVNNAGAFHGAAAVDFPEEAWDHAFAVDAKAAFLCSQEAIRRMIPRGGGRIVVVSSIAGVIVRTGQIAYSSAKAAAVHFARCLAVEVAPHGITVNCLCPGMTDSAMLRQTAAQRGIGIEDYLGMIPDGRFATPEDHANTIAWLATPEAAHVTGQVVCVDGGQSLYHPLTLRG